ncbi:MAG TPA: tetratricopeptide repeat-containing protein, partial [Blastocatellia bacterium]|nr:tetratricopeptide repeat-containing protein [Blastocatellia bacterium]
MVIQPFLRSMYHYWAVACGFVLLIIIGFSFVQLQVCYSAPNSGDKVVVDQAREEWVRQLEPERPVGGELAGGQSHLYQVRLDSGQYLRLSVEQRGIDVVVRLFRPGSKPILEVDAESRLQGSESVSMVAEAAGDYRLAVQPKLSRAATGRYEIRIEEMRAATERDRASQDALELYTESVKFYLAGRYREAFPLAARALETRESLLGPEHPEVARALLGLANLYRYYKDDSPRAEPLYRRALDIFEKTLGAEHPEFASTLNNLALLFRNQGDYAKATPLIQRALAIREQVLGPEHPEVAASLNSLAILYIERGEYAKAEPLYQRA